MLCPSWPVSTDSSRVSPLALVSVSVPSTSPRLRPARLKAQWVSLTLENKCGAVTLKTLSRRPHPVRHRHWHHDYPVHGPATRDASHMASRAPLLLRPQSGTAAYRSRDRGVPRLAEPPRPAAGQGRERAQTVEGRRGSTQPGWYVHISLDGVVHSNVPTPFDLQQPSMRTSKILY